MPYILATAGHVDHGKSSLVKALTGIDPDRLPEEKARGITIDLGFAQLTLPVPSGHDGHPPTDVSCGIVDVPGHEDFVKNMVAGVGSIDLALLVVAADDGWMPQTEEHLQILLYLGVHRAVVALTKIDLTPNPSAAIQDVREHLAGTPFADSPIVPTALPSHHGLETLKSAIADALARMPAPPDYGKPRLWIDRAFVLKGIGTVVTGTLAGGTLSTGSAVVVQPFARPSRIRSCHTFGRITDRVAPGSRVALNLTDLSVGEPGVAASSGVARGDVVSRLNPGQPALTLDAILSRSPRLCDRGLPASRPMKDGLPVMFHLGSCAIPATLHLLAHRQLLPGQHGLAQLRLEQPVLAFAGDPFILRDASQQTTLAGGMVLDPTAGRSKARNPARLALLAACSAPGAASRPDSFVRLSLAPPGLHRLDTLLALSRFSTRDILAAVGRLSAAGEIALAGAHATRADWWTERRAAAIEAIDAHHQSRPDLPGLPLTELRSRLGWNNNPDPDPLPPLTTNLLKAGFEIDAQVIRRVDHRPTLPPDLQAAGHRIRQILDRRPLDPPARSELAPDALSRRALAHLLQTREFIELNPDVILASKPFTQARDRIVAHLRRTGAATASELRELLGTTRRILIPLLEHLDRSGVTLRDGDSRRLVTASRSPPAPPLGQR